MKKIANSLLALLISFFFMACPYKSDVPLDETPMEPVQTKFLGKYEKKNSTTYTYTVERDNDKRYKIIETSKSGKEYYYYAWTSTIGGQTYLQSYQKPTTSTAKKYYYVYRLDPAKSGAFVTLQPLTKNIKETFTSAAEFRRFIKNNQDLSFLFDTEEKYYKSE